MPTIALVGNPNVGKTTLFNALTGLKQVTGNYPGVTVERKAGTMRAAGTTAELVDLPGTYSLAARSPDEMVVVDVLLNQQPGERAIDGILAVADASNLERNLYLVSQLRELGKPLVVALNMVDIAAKRGIRADADVLTRELGVPVVPVCASRGDGLDALRTVLMETVAAQAVPRVPGPEFPATLQAEADGLCDELNQHQGILGREIQPPEAFRILVDVGGYAESRVLHRLDGQLSRTLAERRQRAAPSGSLAAMETRSRYHWIRQVVAEGLQRPATRTTTATDRIDYVLTHKVYGTVVFLAVMFIVFQAIYKWAVPFMDFIDASFAALGAAAASRFPEGALQSLVADGIIGGVGSVIIFLPQILILSLFIAVLEDCGYMARAAFLMDKLLSRCGLSGQSFIPLLSSFACAIPGIMACRTIGNRRDRFTTMLVAPLMSCSARLPVYIIMIGAFIPAHNVFLGFGLQGITLMFMYGVGVAVAIPMAYILKKTLLKGETPPFLLELPSYKMPHWRTVGRKVYSQGKEFLRRAGTIILAITIIVWALAYFPRTEPTMDQILAEQTASTVEFDEDALRQGYQMRHSFFGQMGHFVEPVVAPLGWDWRIGMAVIASFPAREVVVAVLGTVFNLGEVDESSDLLRTTLQSAQTADGEPLFNVAVALSIMVFFALCCQCGATLAVLKRETGTWRWPIFTFAYMTGLAYVAAFLTYHVAALLGGA